MKGQSLSVKGFKDTQVHKSVDEYITYTTSDIHGDGQLQIQEVNNMLLLITVHHEKIILTSSNKHTMFVDR